MELKDCKSKSCRVCCKTVTDEDYVGSDAFGVALHRGCVMQCKKCKHFVPHDEFAFEDKLGMCNTCTIDWYMGK